jgi:hypothetical protein
MPVPFLYVYADSYQSWFHRFYRGRDTNIQIFMMKVQHISLPQAVYYIRLYTHTHTHTHNLPLHPHKNKIFSLHFI